MGAAPGHVTTIDRELTASSILDQARALQHKEQPSIPFDVAIGRAILRRIFPGGDAATAQPAPAVPVTVRPIGRPAAIRPVEDVPGVTTERLRVAKAAFR